MYLALRHLYTNLQEQILMPFTFSDQFNYILLCEDESPTDVAQSL